MTVIGQIEIRTLLYLTDFSASAEAALPFAITVARSFGSTIHLLHVLNPSTFTLSMPELAGDVISAEMESAEEDMARLAAQLGGVASRSAIERGTEIWPIIQAHINADEIDLIAVGTHGCTGPAKLLLGSVAEEILRRSAVPVLTVGPRVPVGSSEDQFRRILFATDFQPGTKVALSCALALAQKYHALLLLLHVLPEDLQGTRRARALAIAESTLRGLLPPRTTNGCQTAFHVQTGKTAETIQQLVDERQIQLIVMAAHTHAVSIEAAIRLERTVVHDVVAHALCPVLTVPQRPKQV